MSQIELNNIEKNKELVLEAFDTLFKLKSLSTVVISNLVSMKSE